jgi:TatD DNase family protein
MLTDTHCHLFYDEIKKDIVNVLNRAEKLGVNRFICVGTNMEDSLQCLELAEKYENIFASAGIHPHDSKNVPPDYLDQVKKFMKSSEMVAIGEIGLDYYRNISLPDIQRSVFREQMQLAQELKKPVIFHNRDADIDVINVLSDFPDVIGVAHCFSSTISTAKTLLDMGYYISFSGNLTFRNSNLPEVAKYLPLDGILVETDSPYLSPVPYRGKRNEPGRTRYVAEKLAEIHQVPLELVARKTTENANRLFYL